MNLETGKKEAKLMENEADTGLVHHSCDFENKDFSFELINLRNFIGE